MLNPNSQSLQAPGIGARILQVHNNDSLPPYMVVENKDRTGIVGTSKSIPPGQSDGQIVQTNKRLIALFAQGNVLLDVHVVRYRNGQIVDLV